MVAIINKEKQEKLRIIAKKMQKIGLGQSDELYKELLERYVKISLLKLTQ